jgi:alkyl sulfatase BDS1-like metallo-beta-lactamase superfamily hydrolase
MGRELEGPLVELCRWGLRHGIAPTGEAAHDPRWTVLAMRAAFQRDRARGIRLGCEFRVDDTVFYARVEDGELTTAPGPATDPELVLTLGDPAFRELVAGTTAIEVLLATGRAELEGDVADYHRFAGVFEPGAAATDG